MSDEYTFGIIGGSGLYDFPQLTDKRIVEISTPFGSPSSPIVTGIVNGHKLAFLARHGIGHFISPSEVNYRANIWAFKELGIKRIISVSACGSLREDYKPGDIVIPDQVFDYTHKRPRSFFEDGLVVHVAVGDPFCADLSHSLAEALQQEGAQFHKGGAYITIEGPRFSTRAESNTFRSWDMSLIGMTCSPEVFLAREAEICYATMAHVTDYDCWHVSEEAVTVEMVIKTLMANTATAQKTLLRLAEILGKHSDKDCACQHGIENAIITNPQRINPATKEKLGLLVNKYLK
ncbi:MAG: S-methyl-5'-thioadenosine phosphorylase [Anaerolineaceae bacterium]|nr:S-methyl-5'-thioadenosine phosphorylase [Anaerolineaceae bacterium]